MTKISDYDMFDYDYRTYWENREYENMAEKILLERVFDKTQGVWFLDIGGSYGRLTSTYYNRFSNPIILDYSLKTLQKNKEILKSKYKNISLIAANAYNLPFAPNSIDGGLMVRVLHHIEKPATYFKEIARVMKYNSPYIQEFPNMIHIKASIRELLKFNFSFFKQDSYKQPTRNNFEGVKEGVEGIFLNYHPKFLNKELKKHNFKITERIGCSFLRLQFLKKFLNVDSMLFLEVLAQKVLSWTNISPSIFLKTSSQNHKDKKEISYETLEDMLVCPKCKEKLTFPNPTTAVCSKCSTSYIKDQDIWDFRVK